jgi:hypothetical protein
MDTLVELGSTISDPELRHINFFNGRLLSGEDLSAERDATHTHVRHLGQAIGAGVACGLEVSRSLDSPMSDVRVEIKAGLAVNRAGQTLHLRCNQTLSLVRPPDPATRADCVFSDCERLAAESKLSGDGFYVLTIAPASQREGLAIVSGLGNDPAPCNSRYFTEGVQFRLLPLEVLPGFDADHARNAVAYQCFGRPATQVLDFLSEGLGLAKPRPYGIDSLVPGDRLTASDVPLAVIQWSSNEGLGFVDTWMVRRPLSAPEASSPWAYFTTERRPNETRAMFLQFQDHIADFASVGTNLSTIAADDYFTFLPSAGLLPVRGVGSPDGFDPSVFFDSDPPNLHASRDVALLDASLVKSLLNDSFHHDPLHLSTVGKVQLYLIWESVRAVETGAGSQLIMAFAGPTLPYRGTARFGYAKWGLSRFTPSII